MGKTKFGHNLGKSRGKQGNLGKLQKKIKTFGEKSGKFRKIRRHEGNSRQIDGNIEKAGGKKGKFWQTGRHLGKSRENQ